MDLAGLRWGMGIAFLMLVFWVLLIIGIDYLIRRICLERRHAYQPDDRPLDILKKRYAAGEITKDQYDRIKEDLKT